MGNLHAFMLSADFFKIIFFEKFFQEYHQSQTVWIQIRTDKIWVQAVCKSYQQTTLEGKVLIESLSLITVKPV